MPTDKPKHPGNFPLSFHFPLSLGPGKYFAISGNREEARLYARKYRCFLRSLQDYPLHPSTVNMNAFSIKTKAIQAGENEWNIYVIVKDKIEFNENGKE